VTKQEAYNAFLSALYMNQLTIVSMGRFLKVVETKDALQSNTRVFVGDYAPPSEEVATILYQLKFLNAEEIQRFIVDLVPRTGRITAYPNTNTLVMTDTGLNLRRIISVLKNIDVPGHEDQLENIPIRYASAKGVAALIDDILEAQNGRTRPGGGPRGPQKTRGGGVISKIVPDERTNSLVVLANGRGVQELKNLISKLDTPNASSGNIHIYYCKNAVAEELAATINALLTGQKPTLPNVNPVPNSPAANTPFTPRATLNQNSGDGVRLEGNIKVTADKATNSLVAVGSAADFAALKNILKKLDIPRRQVYVEATIMEISAGSNFQFGLIANIASPGVPQSAGFLPKNSGVKATDLVGIPSISGVVAGISAGRVYSYTASGQTFQLSTVTGLIRALNETNQGQILHQPQILTSDNQDAVINVKDIIPTLTTEVVTGTATTSSQKVEKNPVEISLKLTPQIGENSDLVKLKVEQSIDDFQEATTAQGQIQVTQRKANTTVVVRNGDTVVIGGLQKMKSQDSRSKVPLLGDIPIIGNLFKYSRSEGARSDLVLFLTPHVINDYSDLIRITGTKLDERIDFGKDLFDPKDTGRPKAQAMRDKAREDLKKAPPRSWGFRSKQRSEEEDLEEEEQQPLNKEDEQGISGTIPPATATIEATLPRVSSVNLQKKPENVATPGALKREESKADDTLIVPMTESPLETPPGAR